MRLRVSRLCVGSADGRQVHVLHRHGARYPTGADEDAVNDDRFAAKIYEIVAKEGQAFSGPLGVSVDKVPQLIAVPKHLERLPRPKRPGPHRCRSRLHLRNVSVHQRRWSDGRSFWNTRGRLLYNATIGQPYYNASFTNGTVRPKPVLRTTSQARILDSALAWANGEPTAIRNDPGLL